jgi:hypothetical protein
MVMVSYRRPVMTSNFAAHLQRNPTVVTDNGYGVMQALGNACFELDPEARPTFKQCVEHLSSMLAACGDATRAQSLEARSQTRPGINGNDLPDVLLCTTQAPIHTEVDLGPLPHGTAVAA